MDKVEESALIEDLFQKVKMRRKEACIYRGNDTEDEGLFGLSD